MINEPKQRPPQATRCPHCGTLAAEYICHTCKKKRNEPIDPSRRDPFGIRYLVHLRLRRRLA